MILFHGTSNNHNKSIKHKGLLPRGNRKSNWEAPYQAQTPKNYVYLINQQFCALFYALRAAIANSCPEGLIVKITDCHQLEDNFYPDENHLIGKQANEPISREQMKTAQKKIKENKDAWKASLERRGILTHKGKIDKTHIADMQVIPNVDNPYFFLAGDSIIEFDRKYQALLKANLHFRTPATVYSDKIKEYTIVKISRHDSGPTTYECYIPCHGMIEVSINL